MTAVKIHSIVCTAMLLTLPACGGGDGPNSTPLPPSPAPTPSPTPTPAPAPTPTPTPVSPPPLPAEPIGLQSSAPFATVSARTDGWGNIWSETDAVKFSYSAADGKYTITLPDYKEGLLAPKSGNGSFNASGWIELTGSYSQVLDGTGPAVQPVDVTLAWPKATRYTYTELGNWQGGLPMGQNDGVFAYGIPTSSADVPKSGTANYTGEIIGLTSGVSSASSSNVAVSPVFGSVFLTFDFANGGLTGNMKPEYAPVWDAVSLGTYTFRDTTFTAGSTTFAGAFDVPGSTASSSFSGRFTGPAASELMARWEAPFRDPQTGATGSMSGVWIGKR